MTDLGGLQRLIGDDLGADPSLDEICAERMSALAALDAHGLLMLLDSLQLPAGSQAKIALYKAWLSLGHDRLPLKALMWFNLASEFGALGDQHSKRVALQNALKIDEKCHLAAINLGLTFEAEQKPDMALATWTGALQSDEARTVLLNQLGRLHEDRRELTRAASEYVRSLLTNPDQPAVLHHLIGLRQKTCDWPVYRTDLGAVSVADMVAATRALSLLAIDDDIDRQRDGNASWIAEKMPVVAAVTGRLAKRDGRVRLGYISTDFCMHPVAYLITELIETHDRSSFEVYGFCATRDDASEARKRLVAAFDVFVPIREINDAAAAALIRHYDIDVLIDLNGLTLGTRLQVLRYRPAPIQITYLGYNGPIPLPELDYIIADDYVIPPEQASRYRPRPLIMPRCFQVNDGRLPIRTDIARRDVGLPDAAFVFCSFSNTYKITETVFAAWMAILRRCPGAVLWLYVDNDVAMQNLRNAAARQGVSEDRIVFARRVPPDLYRGQLALADLFLDTFPYNAGTTASDALRVGLPLVSLSGESFVARMAGSLLRAMDLSDCIVSSLEDYIELAVELAHDAVAYRALRSRTTPGRWRETLGDTAGFARVLEAKLAALVAADRRSGEPSADLLTVP